MDLPPNTVLRVLKPLYGILESCLHWNLAYLEHHTRRLGTKRTIVDPCVFVRREGRRVDGIVLLQVDDSSVLGTVKFIENQEHTASHLKSKPSDIL